MSVTIEIAKAASILCRTKRYGTASMIYIDTHKSGKVTRSHSSWKQFRCMNSYCDRPTNKPVCVITPTLRILVSYSRIILSHPFFGYFEKTVIVENKIVKCRNYYTITFISTVLASTGDITIR